MQGDPLPISAADPQARLRSRAPPGKQGTLVCQTSKHTGKRGCHGAHGIVQSFHGNAVLQQTQISLSDTGARKSGSQPTVNRQALVGSRRPPAVNGPPMTDWRLLAVVSGHRMTRWQGLDALGFAP